MASRSVVVVGAGTVGLVVALGLARRGFDVTVVERRAAPPEGPRDTIYHWSTLPLFAELGMLDGMIKGGVVCTEYSMILLATGENLRLDLSTLRDVTENPFNLHVPQSAVTDVASQLLSQHSGTRIEWDTEVTGIEQDGFGVTVNARRGGEDVTYRADWVIGADGSHSIVRRSLGLSFAGTTWPKHLISCDLRYDLASLGHSIGSTQLDPTQGAIIAEADTEGLWRYTRAESRKLPAEQIEERARAAVAAALGVEDPLIETIVPYRVHQRSADNLHVGRAILVGDAAHLTNPTLAFGMLSGICDAKLLIDSLAMVDTAGEQILDQYSAERLRNFRDFTSPRSSAFMELVYSPGTAARLDERLDYYRDVASSRDATRRFFLDYLGCGSASP